MISINPSSPYLPIQLAEPRATRCQFVKAFGFNVPAGQTKTIFDSTVDGPDPSGTSGVITSAGNVERIQLGLIGTSTAAHALSTISVYVDGEGSPSVVLPIGHLLASWGVPNGALFTPSVTFATDEIALTQNTPTQMGGFTRLFIPYYQQCQIKFTSADIVNGTLLYTQVEYHRGLIPTWKGGPGTRRWKLRQTKADYNALPVLSVLNLINASDGPGELERLNFTVNARNTINAHLEGPMKLTIDGNQIYTYDGTEDFFGGQFYFSGTPRTDTWGCAYNGLDNTIVGGGARTTAYRLWGHKPGDILPYASSLAIDWTNSLAGFGGGTVGIHTSVLHYTGN